MRANCRRLALPFLLGAAVLALGRSGAAHGAFAGGDGKLAWSSGGTIVVAAADGSSPSSPTSGFHPSWNGEGTQIAFDDGSSVKVLTVGTGSVSGAIATGTDPSFSPDGSTIVYVDAGSIESVPAAGGSSTNLSNSSAVDSAPAFSPDGTKIAFARKPSGGTSSIWVMNADGTGQTQLTSSGANDTAPTWSPSGGTIAFQSDRDGASQHQIYGVSASGGLQTRLTNTTADDVAPAYTPDGSTILFSQGGTLYSIPAGGGSATSLGVSGTQPDEQPTIVAGTPSISGNQLQGITLTASPGSWTGVNISFTYQWQRCDATNFCLNVGTGPTYTVVAGDVGQQLQVVVTGTNGASSAVATSSRTATIGGGPQPVNTLLPTITLPVGFDAPQIGLFLSATTGTWSGIQPITYKYQWTKCDDTVATKPCYDIAGATSSFFTPTVDLAHWDLSVTVTATNAAGSTYVRALPTKPVTGPLPVNHGSPRITGENYVKSVLVSDTGVWQGLQPITYAFQWKRCDAFGNLESCVAIPGATTNTYVLQDADLDKTIRVFVTATNPIASVTQFSNHTFPTLPERHFAPQSIASPVVSGTPRPGFLLRTTAGTWGGDQPIKVAYQWERCDATGSGCKPIPGATKDRYTVRTADLGSTLGSKVTATNAYGTATEESADVTDPVTATQKLPKGRHIVGTNRSDYLAGGGGNDVILGRGGNDTIKGGNGNDWIDGGPGNDVLDGGPGRDKIFGGTGSDTIYAADGAVDTIDCGPGNDRAVVDAMDKTVNCESVTVKSVGDSSGTTTTP
jgi:hypothetical protein